MGKLTLGLCSLACLGIGAYIFFQALEHVSPSQYLGPDIYGSGISNLPFDIYLYFSAIFLLVSFYLFKKIR